MTFNTRAPLDQLVALLSGLAGMQQVHVGAPESLSKRVSAYVAVVGQDVTDKAGGLLQREARYFVGLGYRVKGAEATAEQDLAAMLDAFLTAIYAARPGGLSGTVSSLRVDLSLADDPRYQVTAGQEFRVYPLLVSVTQQQTI